MTFQEQNSETTSSGTEPIRQMSSRSRRANKTVQSAERLPAALNFETPRKRQKRASGRLSTISAVPASPNSDGHRSHAPQTGAAIGADEAAALPEPNPEAPRRQQSRTRKGTAGQAMPSPAPTDVVPAPTLSDGQLHGDNQINPAIGGDDGAQVVDDSPVGHSPVVAEIKQLWRMRQRWHRAEKSLILQGRALCRAWTGGDKDKANELFDAAAKGQVDDPFLAMALMPFLQAIDSFAPLRAGNEKRLRKLAKSLPVYPWVAEIKGFGDLNLAAIVGEAGDIGSYRNPSCLWKRMGLAVIGDGRQRRVSGDAALEHGYSPDRRCVAYLLGETLIKAGDKCRYRPLYAERKAYEAERVETKAHAHNRAARYITKRALRDLWSAWRAADRGHAWSEAHMSRAPVGTPSEEE